MGRFEYEVITWAIREIENVTFRVEWYNVSGCEYPGQINSFQIQFQEAKHCSFSVSVCIEKKTGYLVTARSLRKGERMLLQSKYCATLGLMHGAEVENVHIQLASDDTAKIQMLR